MFDFLKPKFTPNASGMKLRSWRPELPDYRDKRFSAPRAPIRAVVDPLGATFRIHNQGQLSACTGHAGTTMVEIALGLRGTEAQLSRLFCYYLAREMIGEAALDLGAYNRDIVKSIVKMGVPRETYWRYSPSQVTKTPSASAYRHAETFRIRSLAEELIYERVTNLDSLLSAINAGQPVMFGFLAYEKLFGLGPTNFVYAMPGANERPVGGHAVVADGYNEVEEFVWVQNSWGTDWGNRGYFKMPFDWFRSGLGLTDDFWTVRRLAPRVSLVDAPPIPVNEAQPFTFRHPGIQEVRV